HFLQFGAKEQRDPGPNFNTQFYLDENGDALMSGVNPLVHYVRCGHAKGRLCLPPKHGRSDVSVTNIIATPVESMAGSRIRDESACSVLVCAHSAGNNLFG